MVSIDVPVESPLNCLHFDINIKKKMKYELVMIFFSKTTTTKIDRTPRLRNFFVAVNMPEPGQCSHTHIPSKMNEIE